MLLNSNQTQFMIAAARNGSAFVRVSSNGCSVCCDSHINILSVSDNSNNVNGMGSRAGDTTGINLAVKARHFDVRNTKGLSNSLTEGVR